MSKETFLVTGAHGCIGAWVLRNLLAEDANVIATDLSTDQNRVDLLIDSKEKKRIQFLQLDVTDGDAVSGIVAHHRITHIIHLAGLQVPFCKANPTLGARVNVVGTINIFEAARIHQAQVRGLSYASSIAVLGPPSAYDIRPVTDAVVRLPETLYGVYKVANEDAAKVYWNDHRVGSVGLRPYIVFGVGRDQGMTSDIAKSILAAVSGEPFQIKFGGPVALQYVEDVASMFILGARKSYQGAAACNLRNDVIRVEEFLKVLKEVIPGSRNITCDSSNPLPFPSDIDDNGLRNLIDRVPHTPLRVAVKATAEQFRYLLASNRQGLNQLRS